MFEKISKEQKEEFKKGMEKTTVVHISKKVTNIHLINCSLI